MLLLAALALNLLQPPDSAANALRADSLTILADQAERTGDLPAAARYLEQRSELSGNADPEAARRLGTVYGWMHEYDLARSWYDAALRADPQNAGAASGLDEIGRAHV